MTEAQLYQRCDEVLGPYLEAKGFRRWQPARYLRKVLGGEECVSVSKAPPSKARTHFSVWISYEPDYMHALDDLYDVPKEDRGVLTPPYLTPVGATWRPKYWSHKNRDVLDRSLQHVIHCLEQSGFAWLESLRDPGVFAAMADPIAALDCGLANEIAGNLEQARQSYEDELRRFREILKMKLTEAQILEKCGKPFIFVATKLDVEPERVADFKRKLNYYPDIKPLPK